MRQDRVGIPRFVYGLLVVALLVLPLMVASCGGGGDRKSPATIFCKETATTEKATTTTKGSTTTKATTTTRK